ncbi:hypothetical protein KJY77_04665 [Canibacter sp. lx-72]|uniref:hypothetical protein n=1 Tax=Canibacter zhuwentaonis TaxID=2837491 RepID=UPI001BDBF461|nr:hypothetical protein [Canibacter zhuwentaonis]MBT1018429.1 hypothetical protein [Canibacter zhuwentaonis]
MTENPAAKQPGTPLPEEESTREDLNNAVAHGIAADPVLSVQATIAEEAKLQKAASEAADFIASRQRENAGAGSGEQTLTVQEAVALAPAAAYVTATPTTAEIYQPATRRPAQFAADHAATVSPASAAQTAVESAAPTVASLPPAAPVLGARSEATPLGSRQAERAEFTQPVRAQQSAVSAEQVEAPLETGAEMYSASARESTQEQGLPTASQNNGVETPGAQLIGDTQASAGAAASGLQPVTLPPAPVAAPKVAPVFTPQQPVPAPVLPPVSAPQQSVPAPVAAPVAAPQQSQSAATRAYTTVDFTDAQAPLTPPSAAAAPQTPDVAPLASEYEHDNPMADFYTQVPMQPEVKGNRGVGVAISLLATLVFGVLYAGAIALLQLQYYPLETVLTDGLLPYLMSPGYIAAVAGFWLSLSLLVLIVGRAGWWAYVLGGFLVALFVWAATTAGFIFEPKLAGNHEVALRRLLALERESLTALAGIALAVRVFIAAVIAREVTVWFGAWIGARGRKMTEYNRAASAEYEALLAEAER